MSSRAALLLSLVLACDGEMPSATASPPVAPAAARPRPAERGFIGVVVAGESVEVEPKGEGRLEEVLVEPGDRVKAGTPLARLDARSAIQELAAARAALVDASRRFRRRFQLAHIRRDAVTAEEIDTARRELRQERARVARLQGARGEATVRAPFDGTVAERYLSPGALCGPGRAVVRLVGGGQSRVRFAVPEERAGRLALGAGVEVRIVSAGMKRRGRVTGISPEVDASSRMVFAVATLDGENETLTTGLIARVFEAGNR